jgi:hypothetical protein
MTGSGTDLLIIALQLGLSVVWLAMPDGRGSITRLLFLLAWAVLNLMHGIAQTIQYRRLEEMGVDPESMPRPTRKDMAISTVLLVTALLLALYHRSKYVLIGFVVVITLVQFFKWRSARSRFSWPVTGDPGAGRG